VVFPEVFVLFPDLVLIYVSRISDLISSLRLFRSNATAIAATADRMIPEMTIFLKIICILLSSLQVLITDLGYFLGAFFCKLSELSEL